MGTSTVPFWFDRVVAWGVEISIGLNLENVEKMLVYNEEVFEFLHYRLHLTE